MANPFASMGGGMPGPMGFVQFMNQHRGQDANQILNQLTSSGRVDQQLLNRAQQTAKQMESQLAGFKSMFGF